MNIHEDGMQHIADLLAAKDKEIADLIERIYNITYDAAEELKECYEKITDLNDLGTKLTNEAIISEMEIRALKAEIERLKGKS